MRKSLVLLSRGLSLFGQIAPRASCRFTLLKVALPIKSTSTLAGLLLLGVIAATSDLLAQSPNDPRVQVALKEASPGEIATWIAELDSETYIVRERATERLRNAGPFVMDPLAVVADGGNLEAATRAVRLLRELSESQDLDLATAALERLASLKSRPLERGAAQTILAGMAERRAVEEIRKLGGVEKGQVLINGEEHIGYLNLGESYKGGDEGLKFVSQLTELQQLEIHGAPVSDEGVLQLKSLRSLVALQLYGTKVTPAGVEALRKELPPNVDIQVRGGALLGVRGSMQPAAMGGALVQDVTPNSAADKAGILPGDVITKFDNVPLADFTTLTDEIAKCTAGQKATLEVDREGRRLVKDVTFDKWK